MANAYPYFNLEILYY